MPNGSKALVESASYLSTASTSATRAVDIRRAFSNPCLALLRRMPKVLYNALLEAATTQDAEPGSADEYGARYSVKFALETESGRATVVSARIIRTGEDFPRLVTCYIE